jgi:hypothetical protein
MEKRANIKFRFKAGRTTAETFQLVKQAYRDSAVYHTWGFEWYARFWDSCENLKGDKCSGRPTVVRTSNMIKRVQELISADL